MAAAYAAFANGGDYYEPYTVHKVVFRNTGKEDAYEEGGKQADCKSKPCIEHS